MKVLDDTDLLILKTLNAHARINQVELAKKIGLTQPAISLRLRGLNSMGLIDDWGPRVDPNCLGMKMAKVDVQASNCREFMEKFKGCPVTVHSYILDSNSMCMILAGESREFLNCMVAHHIENNPGVTSVTSEQITASLRGIRTVMDASKKLEVPPCGDGPCDGCGFYIDNGGECVGCPLTIFYKGTLWR